MMMQRYEVKPMADNFKNGGAPDRSRVSMNNLHDVRNKRSVAAAMSLPLQWREWATPLMRCGARFTEHGHTGHSHWALLTEAPTGYEDDRASTEKRLGVLDTLSQSYGAARPGDVL
jgi:hypothetical protein